MNEAPLLGALMVALAGLLAFRVVRVLQTGEVPLYRKRVKAGEIGPAKFRTVIALNIAMALFLLVLAADLFLGLGLRPD